MCIAYVHIHAITIVAWNTLRIKLTGFTVSPKIILAVPVVSFDCESMCACVIMNVCTNYFITVMYYYDEVILHYTKMSTSPDYLLVLSSGHAYSHLS